MPFYLTRDPVPSADMRNVFDNAQNLDLALNDITSSFWSDRLGRSRMSWFGLESAFTVKLSDFESRFSTQIIEQETTFDASQADKENRFQAFLDSSGYVFLGDYEDGPFQFSARNQYIRYDNQYYRLNATTDIGFTTTGTDAASFANDVTHFVLMDGDTLRQNLGSDEEGMGTWLSTHVQDGVVTQNLHDFLNAAINEITPEMFGGNLQAAFTFASANKLALNLAAKTYVITEPVTFTGGITVFGKGQHKTKIQQTAGTCGIIQTLSATDDPVVYEGFTLETTQDFDEDNRALVVDGSGLVASSGAQIGDRTRRRGMFRDLRIAGSASSRISGIGWGVALDLISLGWYETDGLNIQGCSTKDNNYKFQGIGILHRGGGWTVETYHSDAWMYFLEYCWYCPDYTEGVFIDKWNIVNVTNAIVGGVTDEKWSADPAGKLGVYQASLSNIHINATTVGIYLVNTNYSDVQNIFVLLDDHAVSTANYAVHLRNGKACNASKVNVLHYSTNTGVTRQGIILNAMSDCFISNFQCQSYSADYEKVTSAFNTVNSSNRNVIDGIKVSFADVAVTNGAGCGNTSIKNYRFSSVTSPVLDNNGDMDRGNIDSRYEAFTLSAAADSYTLTIVPRCYMSRRPTGVSAEITSPTTLAFPIQAFPDYANSTATAVSIIVKPTLSGNKLPATTFGVTIIMKD